MMLSPSTGLRTTLNLNYGTGVKETRPIPISNTVPVLYLYTHLQTRESGIARDPKRRAELNSFWDAIETYCSAEVVIIQDLTSYDLLEKNHLFVGRRMRRVSGSPSTTSRSEGD